MNCRNKAPARVCSIRKRTWKINLKGWDHVISNQRAVQIAASAAGLLVLGVQLTWAVIWIGNGSSTLNTVLALNALGVLVALLAWSGILWTGKAAHSQISTWPGWLFTGALGALISVCFLWLDCGHQLPALRPSFECEMRGGPTVAFTFAAIAMTAIAIPSAVRAWLLARFTPAR
jgi:hypothetical protein